MLVNISNFNLLSALRILFLSRLLDLFAISAIFFFVAFQMSGSTPYRNVAIFVSGILFFVSIVALIPASEQFVMELLQRLPGKAALIQKTSDKLAELIEIAEEQRSINSFGITMVQSVLMMMAGCISIPPRDTL